MPQAEASDYPRKISLAIGLTIPWASFHVWVVL